MKIYDILTKIGSKKVVTYKEFICLNIRDIKMSINLYNRYSNGKHINIEYILEIIQKESADILKYYSTNNLAIFGRKSPFSLMHPAETSAIRNALITLFEFKIGRKIF